MAIVQGRRESVNKEVWTLLSHLFAPFEIFKQSYIPVLEWVLIKTMTASSRTSRTLARVFPSPSPQRFTSCSFTCPSSSVEERCLLASSASRHQNLFITTFRSSGTQKYQLKINFFTIFNIYLLQNLTESASLATMKIYFNFLLSNFLFRL